MEKKGCCKCCKCCPNVSFQIKCLFGCSFFLVIITILLMLLILNNTYSFILKEISKLYDLDEFQELDNIENNLENIELNTENYAKNNLQSIVNLYKEFSSNDNINEMNTDLIIKNYSFEEEEEIDENIIYYFFDKNAEETIFEQKAYFSYIFIYLKKFFFNNKNIYNNYTHILLICNYTKGINYFYPGIKALIKQFDQNIIKNYVEKKILEKINDFTMFSQILLNKIDFYKNIFLLPYYDDDYYTVNNDLMNLSKEIFEGKEIKNIAFMILQKNDEEINFANLKENIGSIFLLIGFNDTDGIYQELINSKHKIKNVNLLRTNYLFPYELTGKESCEKILNEGKTPEEIIKRDNYIYFDECFDKSEKLEKLDGYDKYEDFTSYDQIINDFDLYRNIMRNSTTYNSRVFELYRMLEKKAIITKETSFHKSIYNLTLINNQNCKALKTYSPLQILYQTNPFYPIYNIKLHLIIINENSTNDLLAEITGLGDNRILSSSLYLLLVAVVYLIVIIILLWYIQKEIRKPMTRMNMLNNFYSGQIDEDDLHIDEFKEIIKSITFELKYDSDYLNSGEKQENDETKLETENFNKDFEKNKIYNIFVDKEKINKMLEESNYSNEIINNTDLNEINEDTFVKKSELFKECIKMGDFLDLDDYEENDGIIFNKIYFKDKNTLQNQNALFYKNFKKEFSEENKEDIFEEKNVGSDKKAKKEKKRNVKFVFDEDFNENEDDNNINNEK